MGGNEMGSLAKVVFYVLLSTPMSTIKIAIDRDDLDGDQDHVREFGYFLAGVEFALCSISTRSVIVFESSLRQALDLNPIFTYSFYYSQGTFSRTDWLLILVHDNQYSLERNHVCMYFFCHCRTPNHVRMYFIVRLFRPVLYAKARYSAVGNSSSAYFE